MGQASKVEQAISRFESALYKLEASMVKIHEREAQLATTRGESDALQTEHKQLSQELDAVRRKAEQLATVNQQAAKRVDNAITRIKKVLG